MKKIILILAVFLFTILCKETQSKVNEWDLNVCSDGVNIKVGIYDSTGKYSHLTGVIMKEDETGIYLVFNFDHTIKINEEEHSSTVGYYDNIILMKVSKDFLVILWKKHIDVNDTAMYQTFDMKISDNKLYLLGLRWGSNGKKNFISIFDTESGDLIFHKTPFEKWMFHLEISGDGEMLMVGRNHFKNEVSMEKLNSDGTIAWGYKLLSSPIEFEERIRLFSLDIYGNTVVVATIFTDESTILSNGDIYYSSNGNFLNIFVDVNSGDIIDVQQFDREAANIEKFDVAIISKFTDDGELYTFIVDRHMPAELYIDGEFEGAYGLYLKKERGILFLDTSKIVYRNWRFTSEISFSDGAKTGFGYDNNIDFPDWFLLAGYYSMVYDEEKNEYRTLVRHNSGTPMNPISNNLWFGTITKKATGKIEGEMDIKIKAYPNPTNGSFQISLPISEKEVTVEIFNIYCQLISARTYDSRTGKIQFNIEDKPSGLYFIKVYQEDKPITIKVLKN